MAAPANRRGGQQPAPVKSPSRRKRGPAALSAVPEIGQTELEKQIYSMTIEHVQCRDFGHSWRPFSARLLPGQNMFEQVLRCARCTTVRTRHLGMRGQLLDSSYDYVDGYQMKGLGRMSGTDRDVVRLASVRSILIQDTVTE